MVNQQTLQGNWNEIKGKLRTKWGQLTNDEVQVFDGNVDRLVGLIQRKTGETRESVEKYLEEIGGSGASGIAQAAEAVRGYAKQATEQVQETSHQATEAVRHGYQQAENTVRSNPTESLAVCFATGVGVGVLLTLAMRR
ncbi:MAG: CsbD family protein [Planctomycetaceae bacterium]